MIRALLLAQATLLAAGQRTPHAAPRVLVIYATNRLVPAFAQFDNRFRHDLGPRVADADFFTEFLDLSRVPGAEQEERIAQLLRAKYADRPPSVIVAGGPQSSLFVAHHRADLFPGTPLIYGGIPSASVGTLPRDSLTAVVRFDYPVRRTAELAARLPSNVREIVVLSGNGAPDQRLLADARDQLTEWNGPELKFVSDRGFDDLATYVGSLAAGTAVLLLSFDHDPGGKPWEASASVAERLAHAASVPVFGPSETYVGRGVVGGVMSSLDDLSPSIADVVGQILDGVAPPAVTVRPMPVRAVFDARALARWHIASRALPPGADVRFVAPSPFARLRPMLIALGGASVAVALLVGLITVERRRRAAISQSSMSVMAGALAHELGQPLTAQQVNAATALKLLKSGRLDPENAHAILTDIASAAGRASDIARAIGQFLHKNELRREPVALDAVVARTVPRVFAGSTLDAMRVELDVTPETVLGDEVLLEQVVFNLLLNAREAVQRIAPVPGVITIRLARDGDSAVRLEIIDNGPGMTAEAKDRAFDLLFTTKPQGLGLGLSLCRSIVEAHGGTITIERFSERGARFVTRLPTAPASGDDSAAPARPMMAVKTD